MIGWCVTRVMLFLGEQGFFCEWDGGKGINFGPKELVYKKVFPWEKFIYLLEGKLKKARFSAQITLNEK